MGLLAGGTAALLVLMTRGLGNLLSPDPTTSAICYTDERVWIDHPQFETAALIDATRTAVREFAGAEAPEPRPVLESLPLGAVERIRVDTYVSPGDRRAAAARALLSIEADAGRLEYIAGQADRSKLEWIRGYLEYQWSREE